MLVARELNAEGQVTERALILVAINSVAAFVLMTVLLSWIHHEYSADWRVSLLHPIYILAGSLNDVVRAQSEAWMGHARGAAGGGAAMSTAACRIETM